MSPLKTLIVYNTLFVQFRFNYVTLCEFAILLHFLPLLLQNVGKKVEWKVEQASKARF